MRTFVEANTINKDSRSRLGFCIYLLSLTYRWQYIFGDKSLTFTLEHQLEMLVFYHLQGHESGIEFLQAMEEDDFAREHIAPNEGIKKSAFYEAISERGLLQLQEIFHSLYAQTKNIVPKKYAKLAELVAAVGFNVNQGISQKLHLTEGKGGERPFVGKIVNPGQTAIKDRGYQDHSAFDQWYEDGSHFVCRIKGNTVKELITLERFEIDSDFFFFIDGTVLPCQGGQTDRKKGFQTSRATQNGWIQGRRSYTMWLLTAEEVATVYKLRREIEKFFAWWKKRLNVYHLISRSTYGVMVQIFAGLITYLLVAIYCVEEHGEWVNMKRVRELRNTIQNELRLSQMETTNSNKQKRKQLHARI